MSGVVRSEAEIFERLARAEKNREMAYRRLSRASGTSGEFQMLARIESQIVELEWVLGVAHDESDELERRSSVSGDTNG